LWLWWCRVLAWWVKFPKSLLLPTVHSQVS
jgi:hypothetical protein